MRSIVYYHERSDSINAIVDGFFSCMEVACKAFEHNQSCVAVAESEKSQERTNHVAIKLHQFRSLFGKSKIKIDGIDTKKQLSNVLNKTN